MNQMYLKLKHHIIILFSFEIPALTFSRSSDFDKADC